MRHLFLSALALVAAMPADAAWREARSPHFIIYSEDKPEVLKAFATELERFDAAMRVLRGLPNGADSPHNKLTIYRVTNLAAVRKLYGAKSDSIAGFYDGRAGGSVAFLPRFAAVVATTLPTATTAITIRDQRAFLLMYILA